MRKTSVLLKLSGSILLFTILHTVYVPFSIKKTDIWVADIQITRIDPMYSILQCNE